MDWSTIFGTSWRELVEILIRGTIMYLAIFTLMRVLRREIGGLSTPDLLVVVLIADAAQNGMAGTYETVPPGVLLVLVIVFWSIVLDFLVYRFPRFGKLVEPGPTALVREGRVQSRSMRQNLITRDELMAAVRAQGLDNLGAVKSAYIESDGSISVVPAASKK